MVVPVLETLAAGGWRVITPCFNQAVITQGTYIPTVDFVLDRRWRVGLYGNRGCNR